VDLANKFLSFYFSFVAVEGPEAGRSAMSESEAEEIGHSMTINDELRLCGMAGDDEDDVIGDAEALLGPRAAEELFNRTHALFSSFMLLSVMCSAVFFLFFVEFEVRCIFLY
jgi:hypothetical protein